MPSPNALSTHTEWNLGLVYTPPRAGRQSRSLGLRPPEQAVLSPAARPGSARTLQDPIQVGWATALLSSSLGPSLPMVHDERLHPQWKVAPRWPTARSGVFPVGAVAEQRWHRSSSSVQDGGPGPEYTVDAPGQGPPLS